MLIDNLYTYDSIYQCHEPSFWTIKIKLNPEHPIYAGHFPQHPVVPGVCLMQIIKESVEDIRKESLQYTQVTSCKFVLAVNPKETPNLTFELELKEINEGTLHVLASGMTPKGVFIKLKAILHTRNTPSPRHG